MMDNDEFLDWLEHKLEEADKDPNEDHLAGQVLRDLIFDFNNEFDTRDSPDIPHQGGGPKKKPAPDFRGPGGGEPCI